MPWDVSKVDKRTETDLVAVGKMTIYRMPTSKVAVDSMLTGTMVVS
jgi:hypothetical protein